MLRSPWLGPLALALAGIVGYALSDASAGEMLDEVTVTIRPTRDSGAAWDFGGGKPDPRVRVEEAGAVLATCEAKDVLLVRCAVGKAVDRAKVRVIVVDVDNSDDDPIGEAKLGETSGALTVGAVMNEARPGRRFLPLWIALAIGAAVAGALALYRKRHA